MGIRDRGSVENDAVCDQECNFFAGFAGPLFFFKQKTASEV